MAEAEYAIPLCYSMLVKNLDRMLLSRFNHWLLTSWFVIIFLTNRPILRVV